MKPAYYPSRFLAWSLFLGFIWIGSSDVLISQTLLLNESFSGNTGMQLYSEAEAGISIGSDYVVMTGGSSNVWTGSGNSTSYTNAFTDNYFHRASLSKQINAQTHDQLQLQIRFKQKAEASIKNSWLRVLINGSAITDSNGRLYHNPVTLQGDSMQYAVYNLDAWAGTSFVLSLQSSCKLNPGDAVIVDEIRLVARSISAKQLMPYAENFSSGFLPLSYISLRDSNSYGWQIGSYGQLTGSGNFAFSLNTAGDGVLSSSKLLTPVFDFTYQSNISLNLNFAAGTGCQLLASTDGGSTWPVTVVNFSSTQGMWQNTSISLSAFNGLNNVRFAFAHTDNTDQFSIFALDNLSISASNSSTADLQLKAFVSPIQQTSYSNTTPVKVRVKNTGQGAVSNFSVSYTLNGGLVHTTAAASPLNTGDSIQITFTVPADLGAIGSYTFKAWTNASYDTNHGNDTLNTIIQVTNPIISAFPYIESFEGAHYWQIGGSTPDWSLTLPSATIINSASDGVKAWVTNPTGPYGNFKKEWVMSPIFNFSGLQNPELQLDFICHTFNFEDGACIQYSLDGGSSWTTLGSQGDTDNWYTAYFISALSLLNSSHGWSGTLYSNWTTAIHSLSDLAGQPSVRFRVFFGSEYNMSNYEGFAFDKFIIKELQAYDPGLTEILYPTSGCILGSQEPVTVKVKNLGFNAVSGFTLSYSQDGLNYINELVNQSIPAGGELIYTFNQLANFGSSGGYQLYAGLSHPLDGYNFNNQQHIEIEYAQPTNLPYSQNFEGGSLPAGWERSNALGANGWLISTDYASTYFPIPAHTSYAASNDDSCYCNSSADMLITPYFDLTYYTSFSLNFDAFYTGQFYSSAVVLVSTDCGYSWEEFYFLAPNVVNWQNFTINLNAYAGESKLRIAFKHDDNNGWASGFAIDNVSFSGNSSIQAQQINLITGWGIMSTYIEPTMPNVADVFAPVVNNLIIMKNENGSVYWPGFGLNAINNMMIGEGYQTFMSAPASLSITGVKVQPQNTPISLNQNWNIVGYLRTSAMAVETALSGINNSIVIVKDENGMVYWPAFGVNMIQQLQPGKGYQIKLSAAATLTYPAN